MRLGINRTSNYMHYNTGYVIISKSPQGYKTDHDEHHTKTNELKILLTIV